MARLTTITDPLGSPNHVLGVGLLFGEGRTYTLKLTIRGTNLLVDVTRATSRSELYFTESSTVTINSLGPITYGDQELLEEPPQLTVRADPGTVGLEIPTDMLPGMQNPVVKADAPLPCIATFITVPGVGRTDKYRFVTLLYHG